MFDDTKLVWDLQRANQIAQSFSTSLDLEEIARLATDGLVKYFDCAFARIWLVEPDRKMLRLVASSGLYTRTDGSFSRIPMGAFKIGRIAQNRVSLLSNNLASESWVRYPEWAIANKIRSFAGYPLANSDKVIGVLAAFSHNPMRPEFLKVLLSLCTTLTVALEIASLHQQETQDLQAVKPEITLAELSLSDRLAYILGQTKLTVLGTERSLDLSQTQVFLKVAEILKTLDCTYCRLTYEVDSVSLEAIAAALPTIPQSPKEWERAVFGNLFLIASCFGGSLKINTEASIKAIQVSLTFPSPVNLPELSLRIQCRLPLLQIGFTQLAYSAGLRVCASEERHIPLLTDRTSLMEKSDRLIWVNHNSTMIPSGAKAQVDLSTTSSQLREAVETVMRGDSWGLDRQIRSQQRLTNREQEVIALLAKGLRDRNIADQLYISDSTVKFHISNILAKLKAKTRLQALYKLMRTDGLEL
ncbi:GAF domain-containing protein [Pleurocapsales cyanobacterium LEGE 06147]|nr:GAF domain-containing protein [Pleurocapsales cyanobacterium LEGE 06147]